MVKETVRDAQPFSSEGKGNDRGINAQQPKSIYSVWFCQDLTALRTVGSLWGRLKGQREGERGGVGAVWLSDGLAG